MSEPDWKRRRAGWGFGYSHPHIPEKKKKPGKKRGCLGALLPLAGAAGWALARARGLI